LASSGETTAPCGVPLSLVVNIVPSNTPTFSHLRIRRSASITDWMFHETRQPVVVDRSEERANIGIDDPVYSRRADADPERIQRIVLTAAGPESV
jgi:hypothetical protein